MDRLTYNRILAILHQEVKPALGCTEPIAVAIAVSRAAAEGTSPVERVVVRVSPNILKNAMGVGIPGTGLTGLPVAAALAVICGNYRYGLEVLRDVNSESAAAAKKYVDEGRVSVALSDSPKMLCAEAECFFTDGSSARAIIEDHHDSIVYVAKNGFVLSDLRKKDSGDTTKEDDGKFLVLSLINEFARTADLEDLELMKDMVTMNTAISEEGLRGDYGLRVGKTILDEKYSDVFGSKLCTRCMAMTAAASDARMAGCTMPAMSNSGSGNQGLTVSLPVIAAARHLGSSEEELLRALALSNLIAIHIKSYLGRLSALCGCVVASTGAACGIVMLRGGDVPHMGAAIKNMIGSITGMVCDGAKEGCAMKVASGVSCALQSAVLALNDICIHPTDGIIDQEVEKTIGNLGEIGSRGMLQTDSVILDIMVSK